MPFNDSYWEFAINEKTLLSQKRTLTRENESDRIPKKLPTSWHPEEIQLQVYD